MADPSSAPRPPGRGPRAAARPRHLRRQPRGADGHHARRVRPEPVRPRADHRSRHQRGAAAPGVAGRATPPPTSAATGSRRSPSVNELVAASPWPRQGAVRRRPGRPGRRGDPRAGGRRRRAGRRRLRPARVVDRHGGGAGARRAAAVRGSAATSRSSGRTRDAGDPLAGAEVVVRARIENHRIAVAPDRGQRDPGRPAADGAPADGVGLDPAPAPGTRPARASPPASSRKQVRVVAPHVGGAFGGKAGIASDHARGRRAPRARSAGRWRGPRPAARRCSRCTAAARCSTSSSGSPATAGSPGCGPHRRRLRRLRRLRRRASRRARRHIMAQGPYVIPRIDYDGDRGR